MNNPYETLNELIIADLKTHYDILCMPQVPVFSLDKDEEARKLKRYQKAFKRVLKYYGADV